MIPLNRKIKKLILLSGKTQVRVAKDADIHINTLRNILNGKQTKNISLRVALGVAKSLKITVEELVRNTEYEIRDKTRRF